MTTTPDGTVLAGIGASITDAAGNVWAINSSQQVTVNGTVDATTADVGVLAYDNGLVWQENADDLWWSKTSPCDPWIAADTNGSPVPIPNGSANDTTIDYTTVVRGFHNTITDASGNSWGLREASTFPYDIQVEINGVVDPTTAHVTKIEIVNNIIWQENTAGEWYSKTTPASPWSARTFIDPISGKLYPVWVGSGENLASDAANWNTGAVPEAGDVVTMTSGTMNVTGRHALAGDTLNVDLANGNPYDGGTANINLAPCATLTMNARVNGGFLNVSGGTVTLTGANVFDAYRTVLAANLEGTGTVSIAGGNDHGELLELNGKVGSGLTFIVAPGGVPDASIQIDHPADFHATIDLTALSSQSGPALGDIGFLGLEATRGELLDGMLQLFNVDTLVDTIRIKSGANANLHLVQDSTGVMLTTSSYGDVPGTIPLHVG